jgi:hypothetical protein
MDVESSGGLQMLDVCIGREHREAMLKLVRCDLPFCGPRMSFVAAEVGSNPSNLLAQHVNDEKRGMGSYMCDHAAPGTRRGQYKLERRRTIVNL